MLPFWATLQFLKKFNPADPGLWSALSPRGIWSQRTARISSNLSWAKVAASVIWPPEALFLVEVAINPASANRETDKMIRVMRTSIRVNPLDVDKVFNVHLPKIVC